MDIVLSDKKYPINNADQLTKAASYFDKYLTRFSAYDRVKIAHKLEAASRSHSVNLNMPWITNYGRMFKSAAISPDFSKSIELRKIACRRHGVKINDLNEFIGADKILDGILKLASKEASAKTLMSALEAFDKNAGLEYLYDKEILDPVMSVHGCNNNHEFDAVKIANDATQYDMLRASKDKEKLASIKKTFGEEFSNEFKKNPILSLKKLASIELETIGNIVKK